MEFTITGINKDYCFWDVVNVFTALRWVTVDYQIKTHWVKISSLTFEMELFQKTVELIASQNQCEIAWIKPDQLYGRTK